MFIHNSDFFKRQLEQQTNSDGSVPRRNGSLRLPYYNGNHSGLQKNERTMLTKIMLWLWYGAGLPALVVSWLSYLWIHIGDVKEFILIVFTVITGVSKIVIMWSEKGDKVWFKIKRLYYKWRPKPKRRRKTVKDDTQDNW